MSDNLLKKAVWNVNDIMQYFNCGKSKAYEIKLKAIENDGAVPYSNRYVKTDSVLAIIGTSRELEMKILDKRKL